MDSRLIFRTSQCSFDDGVTQKDKHAVTMAMAVDARKLDPAGKSAGSLTVRRKAGPYGDYDADFTLPRKTSKENKGNRTPNRHR